ncbi:nitroreductase family protein [Saccharicrinis fermentans]|uniref:Putative NAD(P)H nitroreductase YodC n=1 Tax=Saccharicrinis fermentans DSM 9555 = JCM 21142 TaxID=869213 RepID=W7YHP9_9BACT|nr:nitroreductase family protein [Saccharicrinis fermentans]GAF04001.1 putative NAD(P)H nitroreductase YodC [Saccharicrinis fermentans DSM 9555 = JCM 21142]
MLKDLILKNRSYRRFHQEKEIGEDELIEFVNLARLSPSARNAQPLKYVLVHTPEKNSIVFKYLSWAGYLSDWHGPKEGERPSAYIIMVNDTSISSNFFSDNGIASQSILLGAVEKGYGGCIIGSVERLQLQRELDIPTHLKIVQVIALGVPKEEVVIEELDKDYKYWRDLKEVHHVPKRNIHDIIVKI